MDTGFLGDVFSSGGGALGLFKNTSLIIAGLFVLGICGYAVYHFTYKKKNWNIDVEIKIPRSDGKLVTAEWGKGNYNEVKGACFIKRKGKQAVAMKPFDPKKYLQGEKILTVLQLSPGHYVPILPESFLKVTDSETKEVCIVAHLNADLSKSKAWARTFERDSKNAFSIINLLKEYAPFIGIGIILFMNFAGFAILYSKVT